MAGRELTANSARRATHAGSWYTSNGEPLWLLTLGFYTDLRLPPSLAKKLSAELDTNLAKVTPLPELQYNPPITTAKAIIAPHAGYSYSGPAAAWAYAAIPTEKIERVFLLGPAHHVYLHGVALSSFEKYKTPLGDLALDLETIDALRKTRLFERMSAETDEEEHSLELHLPYIKHVFGEKVVKLVPLLVGRASRGVAAVLAEYWHDEKTFFIVSSDFCHWGTRFSHTPYYPHIPDSPPSPVPPVASSTSTSTYDPAKPLYLEPRFAHAKDRPTPIWQSIQYMDHEGMAFLRRPAAVGAKEDWEAYLARTKHVYGGKEVGKAPEIAFVRYEQSSQCLEAGDSSVSYVSGVLRVPE
ncbi:MEMO1 family protein, partial [Tremellales sp. Uapishka_1]